MYKLCVPGTWQEQVSDKCRVVVLRTSHGTWTLGPRKGMTDSVRKTQTSSCGASVGNNTADTKYMSGSAWGLRMQRPTQSLSSMREVRGEKVRHREVKSLAHSHMQPVRAWAGSNSRLLHPGTGQRTDHSHCFSWPRCHWLVSVDDYHTPGTTEGGYHIRKLDLMWSHIFHMFHVCNLDLPKWTVSSWILTFTTHNTQQNWGTVKALQKCVWSGVKCIAQLSFRECRVSAICWERRASLTCCSN